MTEGFNKLHKVCFVMGEFDTAQADCQSVGIARWESCPPPTEYTELVAPDRADFDAMKYHMCNLSDILTQLCDPSPQWIFLGTKDDGACYPGIEVPEGDLAAAEAQSGAEGYGTRAAPQPQRLDQL